jgi:hypothetical protein
MAYQQSDADLIKHLLEQVEFLRASGRAYDEGEDAEAKRLAVVARLLCHETTHSHSLLGQIGLLDFLRFVDTGESPGEPSGSNDENSEEQLTWISVFYSPLAPMGGGPRGYYPRLDAAPRSTPKSFDTWWTSIVLQDAAGNALTRRDIVLAVANSEGGAHVDPKLKPAYAAVAREDSLGTIEYPTRGGERRTVDANPVLAVMRQIAYELEKTLGPVVGPTTSG